MNDMTLIETSKLNISFIKIEGIGYAESILDY